MKMDRFVKIMLVLIAGLLVLNFAKNDNSVLRHIPTLETPVEASTPSFIQVGKRYTFGLTVNGYTQVSATVASVDREGWVQQNTGDWINMDFVATLKEVK